MEQPEAPGDMPLRILHVDDDRMLVRLFRDYVQEAQPGWTVVGFSDPHRAVQYLRGHGGEVDVMVCDVHMPRVSGIELLNLVASLHPSIVRISVSGMIDRHTLLGTDRTAEVSVCKPIRNAQLCETIAAAVRSRRDGGGGQPGG